MRRPYLLASVLAIALVTGCASIGGDECRVADWRTVGLEDGVQGASPDAIARYRKACAEHSVVPDLDAYMDGRAEGLRSFCAPGNGFNLGAQGGVYGGVCPQESEREFLDAYAAGHKLYELETAAGQAADNVAYANDELAHVRRDIAASQAELISGETSTDRRVQLALDIRDLAKRQGELEHQIPDLERQLNKRNNQLARYRNRLAYNP